MDKDQDMIFSWAENDLGQMVHVDSVERGIDCKCHCPNCKEPLMAKHGKIRAHHFAHRSEERGANLEICYQVILYKLAEQIILTKKKIYAPSYYDIFPPKVIEFCDVQIDSQYEREDKQPDVIATGLDGKVYLIEFIFDYKVQHKKPLDYKNLNCIEIDLSKQTLEGLETFLLDKKDNRKWINNDDYFNYIEEYYHSKGKNVKIKNILECQSCPLYFCEGAKPKNSIQPLILENGGTQYKLCKVDSFNSQIERIQENKRREQEEMQARMEMEQQEQMDEQERIRKEEEMRQQNMLERQRIKEERLANPDDKLNGLSCFNCKYNLKWANRNGNANCSMANRLGLQPTHSPEVAKDCIRYKQKNDPDISW